LALLLLILTYSAPLGWEAGAPTLALAVGVAAASSAAGALIGFLFGIPVREDGADPARSKDLPYRGNTSLEQISDWLVKILVGVGLVQLTAVAPALGSMFDAIGVAFRAGRGGSIFAGAIVIVGVIWGFLFAYLATRTSLPQLLTQSETADRVKELDLRVDRLQEAIDDRTRRDADALRLAHIVMGDQYAAPQITDDELKDLLSRASAGTLTEIYIKATDRRRTVRRLGELERQQMSGLKRIFLALLEVGEKAQAYRYHGQLGLVSMEALPPDFELAIAELSKAISGRPDSDRESTRFYEWNRALCHIELINAGRLEMSATITEKVLSDLRVANADSHLRRRTEGDRTRFSRDFDVDVHEWLETNSYTEVVISEQ
jgi:hypothetical protein